MLEELISSGFYCGKLNEIFSEKEINHLTNATNKLKEFKPNDGESDWSCRYNYYTPLGFDDKNFIHDYIHDIEIDQIEERTSLIKENNYYTTQKWFHFNTNSSFIESVFRQSTKKILDNFYSDVFINYDDTGEQFTMLESGDFIFKHKDGVVDKRVCVILIYLNKEEDYKNQGGELVIYTDNGEVEIKPIFGNFAILDFTKNNIEHSVNKVKGDFKRYCFTSFINEY